MASDSTQFLIDLAAKLTGGDATVASLDQLGGKMLKAGVTAADLETAVGKTSDALEASGSAVAAASDALTAAEASYKQVESSADRASKAVERVGAMAEAQRGKLKSAMDAGDGKGAERAAAKLAELVQRQSEAVGKSNAAAVAVRGEAAALDVLKAKAAAVSAQHDAMTKGLKSLKVAAGETAKAEEAAQGSGKVHEIGEAFGKLGGPLGVAGHNAAELAAGFVKMGKGLGAIAPYVAVAALLLAVGTAAVVSAIAVAKWGVATADAGRTQELLTAGVARSVAGGVALDKTLAKLGNAVPQTREELLGMADDLAKSGLRGKALSSALEYAAVAAAKLKWGPDFAKQMLSLDNQSKRLGTNIADTFGGLHIEKLLGGVATLVALFDSTTESGKALKFLFELLFQPIIDGASAAIPKVERLFLYGEILALKAYIALRPYSGEIVMLGEAFAAAAAVLVGVLGVAIFSVFASAAAIILTPIIAIADFIAAIYAAGKAIIEGFAPALAWMHDLGTNLIAGLVNGITDGAGAVVKALTDVVSGGVKAAEHVLGIGSPSKVFAAIGGYTVEGFTGGVDAGAGDAKSSLEALVAPPDAGGGGGARAGGGGVSLSIGELHVHGADAKDQADDFIDQITQWLEGDGLSIGGGEAHA